MLSPSHFASRLSRAVSPSITEFQGKYYVAFREARSHVFDENGKAEGKVRVLVSRNGKRWKSVALRDPKLRFPSGGDTSYPGFIEVGDELWMVYYSRHETPKRGADGTVYDSSANASIYLSRIPKSVL